jgi:intracellular sulfur oxidation DsrE/DsrF family protein
MTQQLPEWQRTIGLRISAQPIRLVRLMARLALFLGCTVGAGYAFAGDGAVYVSGQGFSIDQAFNQAFAENPAKSKDRFWIIVAGDEVGRLTKSEANKDVQAWVERARARGGIIYACRSDLARHAITEDELLHGVAEIYGYGTRDWSGLLPAKRDGIILPQNILQSQQILKTCADDKKRGS